MERSFAGKVVVVTGANSGIGEATAVAFQEAGARVFGIARRESALHDARQKHPQISWLLGDVGHAKQIKAAIEAAVKEGGRLDVLVNNAGVGSFKPLEAISEQEAREQFEVNVLGTTWASQAALPALKASKGSIVNIGSAVGHKPLAGGSHYAATKAALESLTQSWALELAPAQVRVNAVAPGPTDTAVFSKLGAPPEAIDAVKASFVKMVPLGRIADSKEVAKWVLLVSAPDATWVTGAVFAIDGGMTLS